MGVKFKRGTYVDTSKKEDTWCRVLGYFDTKKYSTLRYSRGGALEDALHMCYAIFNRNGDKREVNVNSNDNRWNRNYRFGGVRNSLLSSSLWWGSFCKLTHPTTEHPAGFIEWGGEGDIFFIIERFGLPKNHEEYLLGIELAYGESDIGQFFFAREE
ncbi:hypothetical protein BH11PAT3_BH11PAT3_2740 [soil metagenome]